jgi:hypothetical protein
VILCDLCGQPKRCSRKAIEGREYGICSDCWSPMADKLKGKGRVKKRREMVLLPALPPLTREPEQPPKPRPLEPPKIWGAAETVQSSGHR